uniref:Uncharacterized protein n=1 Tax=Arundo donax TaxID=35708 RepID=A0A0A9EAN9_ARUDO
MGEPVQRAILFSRLSFISRIRVTPSFRRSSCMFRETVFSTITTLGLHISIILAIVLSKRSFS